MLTLAQLINPVTEEQALDTILQVLGQIGFQATNWQPNSIQRFTLQLFARVYSQLTQVIASIAAGGYTSLATSGWLTLIARYVYGVERIAAVKTVGQILLTASSTSGVHTWSAGDLIVSDSPTATDDAQVYTCTEGGTIGPSGTLLVEFQANVAGADGNIAPDTTLYLWTPLNGVTATNPVVDGTNTWVTTTGLDEESDQRLATRCMGRWDALTYGNTDGAYTYWALTALPTLTRVNIDRAVGDGTVTIIGANSLGPISSGDCTTIADYINGVSDGVGRRPQNDIVSVIPASVYSPSYTPTLNVTPDVLTTIASSVTAALLSYAGTSPIGGFKITGSGVIPFAQLIAIAQGTYGVRSLSGFPTADIPISADQIFTPSFSFTVNIAAPGV